MQLKVFSLLGLFFFDFKTPVSFISRASISSLNSAHDFFRFSPPPRVLFSVSRISISSQRNQRNMKNIARKKVSAENKTNK